MMNGHHHPYVQAAIEGEVTRLASAREGERNDALFRSTASLASLGLREGEILQHLKPSAEAVGLRGKELYSTVKSGVKAGQSRLRDIPEDRHRTAPTSSTQPPPRAKSPSETLPLRAAAGPDGKRPFFVAGHDTGPPTAAGEIRRHVYRRNGKPVRVKIKHQTGYANWYRVRDDDREGWQAGKPTDYVPCPYVSAGDPLGAARLGEPLYWPEGEKDCDTLASVGFSAFTFGGTGDGLPGGLERYLTGRNIVILADNDAGGREHAAKKAARAYPVAASVRIIEFPELPAKGDVSDYLNDASAADLQLRANEMPLWAPAAQSEQPKGWRNNVISARDLRSKEFPPVRFVLPGYIPEGVTVFAGKPKIGKSWLLYDICVGCASDRFVLGSIKPAQGDVLYLALEDGQRRLKERLAKLYPGDSWPNGLTLTTEWRRSDAGGIEDIAEWCNEAANPLLVVVDTLERFRQLANPGSSAYTTDYLAIAALHKLAHQRGLAIVVIHHVRKLEADDPFDMVSGTNGLTGAADTILVIKRQAGTITLYARGRDIEEQETACQFNRDSCRWTFLGDAGEIHGSGQRWAIIDALRTAGEGGMHISEIMAATGRNDRNALDQLLFKMNRQGELIRVKRGVYADPGKIGKKERSDGQPTDTKKKTSNLTVLTGEADLKSEALR